MRFFPHFNISKVKSLPISRVIFNYLIVHDRCSTIVVDDCRSIDISYTNRTIIIGCIKVILRYDDCVSCIRVISRTNVDLSYIYVGDSNEMWATPSVM